MRIIEKDLDEKTINSLISLSEEWENEAVSYGYRKNTIDDIKSNRIFLAVECDEIVGYLLGHRETAKKDTDIYQKAEEYFEIEELYVKREYRSKGIGSQLFRYMEHKIKDEVSLVVLGTATKNYRAILHFYIEELDMSFWSAALFKRI